MPPAKDPVTGRFLPSDKADQTPETPPSDTPPAEAPPAGKEKPQAFDGARALAESWLGDKPSVVPDKTDDKAATPPVKKASEEPPKPPAKPKQPAKVAPQPAPLTAADIAAAAAEGVARALPRPEPEKKPKEKSEPDESWLSDSDKRKLPILSEMERLNPERYKGISERYRNSKKALVDYAAKWETEHPGETFDETAEEHEVFFKQNDLDWDDDDYLDATAELKIQARLAETDKKTQAKLTEFERKEKLRDSQPKIVAEQNRIASHYWKKFGDDYAKFLNERGEVNAEAAKALNEADPIGVGVRIQFAERLDDEVSELVKLMGVPGDGQALVDFDPKNPIHAELANFAIDQEDRISAMPVEDRRNEKGQMFMPAAEFAKVSSKERSKYWTFSSADLAALRAADFADKANKIIEQKEKEYEAFAKSRGIQLPPKQQKRQEAAADDATPPSDETPDKPSSPEGAGVSKMAAAKSKASAGTETGASAFVLRAF